MDRRRTLGQRHSCYLSKSTCLISLAVIIIISFFNFNLTANQVNTMIRMMNDDDGKLQIQFNQKTNITQFSMNAFCHRWHPSTANNRSLQPFDKWFTHHPSWVISSETDEKFCVEQGNIRNHPHIGGVMQFYANQFHSSCDRVHIRTM